jgi:hypothetical protein
MNCARRSSRAIRPVAGEKLCGPDHPARTYFEAKNLMLDPVELEQISEIWGVKFADSLITDRRWPTCNQPAAIRAAGIVVERAITGIVAILDSGGDFKPHTKMMAETTRAAFWNSMPDAGKDGQSNAPAS